MVIVPKEEENAPIRSKIEKLSKSKLAENSMVYNYQNDIIWSVDTPGTSAIIKRCQNLQSLMICGGICANGKTPIIFIEESIKINQEVY